MEKIIKRIIHCCIRCVTKETAFISQIKNDARYDFDYLQTCRISYIVFFLYRCGRLRLSTELYKGVYYEMRGLIKNMTYEEFYQEITFGMNVYRETIDDFNKRLDSSLSSSKSEEESYFACKTWRKARNKTLIYYMYDFGDYDEENALYGLSEDDRCKLVDIIEYTLNEYFHIL